MPRKANTPRHSAGNYRGTASTSPRPRATSMKGRELQIRLREGSRPTRRGNRRTPMSSSNISGPGRHRGNAPDRNATSVEAKTLRPEDHVGGDEHTGASNKSHGDNSAKADGHRRGMGCGAGFSRFARDVVIDLVVEMSACPSRICTTGGGAVMSGAWRSKPNVCGEIGLAMRPRGQAFTRPRTPGVIGRRAGDEQAPSSALRALRPRLGGNADHAKRSRERSEPFFRALQRRAHAMSMLT